MLNYFRTFLLLMGLICVGLAHADSNTKLYKNFLAHCNKAGVKSKGKQLILNLNHNKKEGWVYIFQNISKKPVYINHPADHPGTASAGWGTRLDVQKWSALMLDHSNFAITCQNNLASNQQSMVACKKVLKVSRFKPYELSINKQGSYWIGEDQSLDKLLKTLSVRGINWK